MRRGFGRELVKYDKQCMKWSLFPCSNVVEHHTCWCYSASPLGRDPQAADTFGSGLLSCEDGGRGEPHALCIHIHPYLRYVSPLESIAQKSQRMHLGEKRKIYWHFFEISCRVTPFKYVGNFLQSYKQSESLRNDCTCGIYFFDLPPITYLT